MTDGLLVFVQLVIAAMTTAPCRNVAVAATARTSAARDRSAPAGLTVCGRAQTKAALRGRRLERPAEGRFHLRQRHPVLRPLGAGQGGLDGTEVQLGGSRVFWIRAGSRAEQPLLLAVALDEVHLVGGAAGQAQVFERTVVHREEAHRRAVLRRHVGERGPVGQAQRRQPIPVELDELVDHAERAQQLGHAEHQVRGGRAFPQTAGQPKPHHLRHGHVQGLPQHGGLGLDAADTPAQHAEAVDHRRMAVGADEGVGQSHGAATGVPPQHNLGQVFEVDLVHDAGGRRHDAKVLEGVLSPAEKLVPLAIAVELQLGVEIERFHAAEVIDLHRVVDDEVHRDLRVDPARVAAEALHGGPHGGQVDERRDAGEVLQEDAGGLEGDLALAPRRGAPGGQRPHVIFEHGEVVHVAEHVFEQDADGVRQVGEASEARQFERVEPVQAHLAATGRQRAASMESVGRTPFHGVFSRVVARKHGVQVRRSTGYAPLLELLLKQAAISTRPCRSAPACSAATRGGWVSSTAAAARRQTCRWVLLLPVAAPGYRRRSANPGSASSSTPAGSGVQKPYTFCVSNWTPPW
jgi:hypothetical protein